MYFAKRLWPYPWGGGKCSYLGKCRVPTTLHELCGPVDVEAGIQPLQSVLLLLRDLRRNARCQCQAQADWWGLSAVVSLGPDLAVAGSQQ